MKWLTDVWMSKLQIFKWSKSLISSQILSEFSASDISVHIKPLDFACVNLLLLSCVKSAAVSMSVNQSSNCAGVAAVEYCYVLKQCVVFALCSA